MIQFLYYLIFSGQAGVIEREDWPIIFPLCQEAAAVMVMILSYATSSMLHKTHELCYLDLIVPRVK